MGRCGQHCEPLSEKPEEVPRPLSCPGTPRLCGGSRSSPTFPNLSHATPGCAALSCFHPRRCCCTLQFCVVSPHRGDLCPACAQGDGHSPAQPRCSTPRPGQSVRLEPSRQPSLPSPCLYPTATLRGRRRCSALRLAHGEGRAKETWQEPSVTVSEATAARLPTPGPRSPSLKTGGHSSNPAWVPGAPGHRPRCARHGADARKAVSASSRALGCGPQAALPTERRLGKHLTY